MFIYSVPCCDTESLADTMTTVTILSNDWISYVYNIWFVLRYNDFG